MWQVYQDLPGLVFGFHGCDKATGERVLATQNEHLAASQNAHDWLGEGIYFWEWSPQRAEEFAEQAVRDPRLTKGKIIDPFVLGAVIDLGRCCNLLDVAALKEVKEAHNFLVVTQKAAAAPMPQNKGTDRAARFLDQAVITTMHQVRDVCQLAPYDTVRGAFWEGADLYEGSSFAAKNHVQIAVRNRQCIKAYFRPFRD